MKADVKVYEVTVAREAITVVSYAPSWSHPIETYRIEGADAEYATRVSRLTYRYKHMFHGYLWIRVWEV